MKSPRLISMLNKKKDLWIDSETDLSSLSDNDSINTVIDQSSEINCCLICSILSSLSNINCCQKHLALLTTSLPAQIVYMMPSRVNNWSKLECYCQSHCSKSKRRHRTHSLPSSKSRHRKRKRSDIVQSSVRHKDDVLLSPNIERTTSSHIEFRETPITHEKHQLNPIQTLLSPTLPSVSLINTNMNNNKSSRKQNKILPTSMITRSKQRNINQKKSVMQNESVQSNNPSTSSDLIELDLDSSYSPRILLNRIVHVKDDDEELNLINSQITLNMAQATEHMIKQRKVQPKILLERVSLKN